MVINVIFAVRRKRLTAPVVAGRPIQVLEMKRLAIPADSSVPSVSVADEVVDRASGSGVPGTSNAKESSSDNRCSGALLAWRLKDRTHVDEPARHLTKLGIIRNRQLFHIPRSVKM